MKKRILVTLIATMATIFFAGCSTAPANNNTSSSPADTQAANATTAATVAQTTEPSFNTSKGISVVSREDGSGTRGAFIELFKVEVKNDDGSKKDMTTKEAEIVNKTDVMLTSIANNEFSIGYVSLGSINDTIKVLDIDGVKAAEENVKNGSYKISRPFNIATKGEATGLAKDFIDFILSAEGQEVVAKSYIAIDENAKKFEGSLPSGKIVVGGSSSVSPIMEKLKEAYLLLNPSATIEIQTSDSTTGMNSAVDGTCDIGMSSRELKDSEKETLTEISIAIDGIAVIVNKSNPATDLTSEVVRQIFTGEITKWSGVIK